MCFHKINLTCACILPYGLLKPNSTIEIVVNLNDTNNVIPGEVAHDRDPAHP